MSERWQAALKSLETLQPSPDLWDRARLGPNPQAPMPKWNRGRVAALGVSVVVAVAAGLVLWKAFGPTVHSPASPTGLREYRNPRFGWTIAFPARFHMGHFSGTGLFDLDGAWFGNWEAGTEPVQNGMGPLRRFPTDGVLFQFWFGQRFPMFPKANDTESPLSLDSLEKIQPYVGGREPPPLYGVILANATQFTVAVWFGPEASPVDRRAIEAMLASIEFPRLREGTVWRNTYFVLGASDEYRPGTVTLISSSELPRMSGYGKPEPFYVVNHGGALYVVHGRAHFQDGASCDVQFDSAIEEFRCPELGLRWNVEGKRFGGASREGDIGPYIATRVRDGHVLYSPFFGLGSLGS